jgi:transposase
VDWLNRGLIVDPDLEVGLPSTAPEPSSSGRQESMVIVIGVDPHKRTHTASAVDAATNAVVATLQIDASLNGYRQLARWPAGSASVGGRWAVENAGGLGRHLAQWLAARGEVVTDVPSRATARVRELSRGGRRMNDVIDAADDALPAGCECGPRSLSRALLLEQIASGAHRMVID